ncbi:MAG TPA: ABC transporter substrate-binding protein, partial [Acidimicrobiales bacterium]|nr:ABC transporter substrate-binding protein [Acidimicrobiales bacterium]
AAACTAGVAFSAAAIAGGGQALAQSSPPTPGSLGTLTDAVPLPTATLDPMFSNSAPTREIDSEVFDELVTYGQSYTIVPDLASSWSQTGSGLDWTFSLHSGVTFSNGQALTGADVVASLQRFIAVGENGSTLGSVVKSITSPSADVVDIDLKSPDADFLALLANPLTFVAIMPAKYAASRTELSPPDLIGTGPYTIESWIPDQYTLLKRNTAYTPLSSASVGGYGGKKVAYYDQLKYEVVTNAETRLLGLESGQFQYAEALPFTAYASLTSNSRIKPEINEDSQINVWYINNYQYPTNNVWFRRAMAQALNDTDIMRVVTQGQSQFFQTNGSGLFLPVQSSFYDPSYSAGLYNSPNPAKVKADLAKAHYHGQPLIILTNQQYEWMYQMAVAAVAQFLADGINAQLDVMTWTAQLTYLDKKSGFGLFTSGNSLRFDPVDLAQNIGPDGELDWGFNNSQIDSLLTAYGKATTPAAEASIAKHLQQVYWQTVPALTIGDMAEMDGISSSLQGYAEWYEPRFWNVW